MDEWKVAGWEPLIARQSKLWEHGLQIFGASGIMRRQKQGLTKLVGGFVNRHALPIGRVFDENASGIADIERQEVLPVMNLRWPVVLQRKPHGPDRFGVRRAEGRMIGHSGSRHGRRDA